MTEKEIYKNGVALLEEWEDVNYCEHAFKFKDEWLTDKEVVDLLNQLNDENEELRNNLENWIQRTLKAHGYFNILEKVIDEVCDDDISNQIWKEYEERERLIE